MPKRVPHILSRNKGNAGHPDLLITFDTETRPSTCDITYGERLCPACERVNNHEDTESDAIQSLVLGWAVFTSLSPRAGKARADDEIEFVSDEVFFDFVETHTEEKRILWVVNHNIAFDLMVLRFETVLTQRGWSPTSMILPDPNGPLCMIWKRDGHTIKFVNLANWWGMRPLKSIGATIGEYKEGVNPTRSEYRHACMGTEAWRVLSHYCRQDAIVVREAVRVWAEFCRTHSMGTFSITQAGQSLNAFRHRFMDTEIYLHNREDVSRLERAAYLGARTECFRVGEFNDSFHIFDVNSLYPSVMLTGSYPTKLIGHMNEQQVGGTPQERLRVLRSVLDDPSRAVVADVSVCVAGESQRVVPCRHDGRLIYPLGDFRAVLTTRELSRGDERGVIHDVHELSVYESGRIFSRYVKELYDLRLLYRRMNNTVFVEIVKVFMNSLYGKFGQQNYEWEPTDEIEGIKGYVSLFDADTDSVVRYRSLGDTVEKRSDRKYDAYNAFPAIAAHITADARVRITELREISGYTQTYYCDTDSLFVTDAGRDALSNSGQVDSSRLGALKLEKSAGYFRLTTLKDYQFGDKFKRKGMRKDAVRHEPDSTHTREWYTQTQFRGFAGALRAQDPNHAIITHTTKTFTGAYTKGSTGPDGWITPITLGEHPCPTSTHERSSPTS